MKFKKIITFLLLIGIVFSLTLPSFAEKPEELECRAAALMDAETGQVIYEDNAYRKMHPASITKILTALIAIENTQPTDTMVVSKAALELMANSTTARLKEGEVITVKTALYSLIIASANDSANVLAEHIAGSQEEFAVMMNKRAKEIGALDTNFENAHGLPDNKHLTTAYDMALITQEAIKNPEFMKYFGATSYEMPITNKNEEPRIIYNLHYMLLGSTWAYSPDVVGGKTGYTEEAGNTLVTVATRGDKTLICIILKSSVGAKFTDTQALFDFGFNDFTNYSVPITNLNASSIPVLSNNEQVGEATLKIPSNVSVMITEDINPDLLYSELSCPEQISLDSMDRAYININLSPNPVYKIPLEYDMIMYPPSLDNADANLLLESTTNKFENITFAFSLAIGATFVFAGILLILTVPNMRKRKFK